jgi:Tfp pilus assembly protein PilN
VKLVAGVELTPTHVRVVMRHPVTGAVRVTHEAAWEPSRPHLVVASLRAQWPAPARIGLAVDQAFLRTAAVTLPPASPDHRRAMIALEPDRFFLGASRTATVALAPSPTTAPTDLAFAIDTAQIDAWIDAFGEWAPVEGVLPAAVARWRMLPAAQQRARAVSECLDVDTQSASAAHTDRTEAGLPSKFLVAAGGILAIDAAAHAQLLSSSSVAQRRRRRQRHLGAALLTVIATVAVVVAAVDRARERQLEVIDVALARQEALTAPVQGDLDRLTQLARERDAVTTIQASRRDPIATLGAVSGVLPRGATVMRLRMDAGGWQIDGSATDAAAVIQAFEQDARFTEVRVLTATTRFMDQGRARESFSIGFHAAP